MPIQEQSPKTAGKAEARAARWLAVRGGPVPDLLLLTWTAGTLDALSYLRSGVFTANMTGNTVILGMALAGADRSRLLPAAVAMGAFSFGILLAGWPLVRGGGERHWNRDLRIGLGIELLFSIAFAVLWALSSRVENQWQKLGLNAIAACGLGVQSVTVRRLKISGVITTFITGTITTAISSLLSPKESGPPAKKEASSPPVLLLMLVCYVFAACLGVLLNRSETLWAGVVPLATVALAQMRSLLRAETGAVE